MKVLLFSGSLRSESLNLKLIKLAHQKLKKNSDVQSKLIDLKKFSLPVYDGDVEQNGFPQGVKNLALEIEDADALIISSPEYNHGISGAFKNTIDWLSRINVDIFKHKSLFLMSASPGGFGGIRGLEQAKPLLVSMGALYFSEEFSLANAAKAFGENGEFLESKKDVMLGQKLNSFIAFAQSNAILFN